MKIVRTRHHWHGRTGRDVLCDAEPTIDRVGDEVTLTIQTAPSEMTQVVLTSAEVAQMSGPVEP